MTRTKQLQDWVLPVIVGAMVGCVALSVVSLVAEVVPGWNDTYLALVCALATASAMYAAHLHEQTPLHRRWGYHILEGGSLLVARQVWAEVVAGRPLLQGSVPHLDPSMVWLSLPVLGCWLIGSSVAADSAGLGSLARHGCDAYPLRNRLIVRTVVGGLVLCVCTWLAQGGLQLFGPVRSLQAGPGPGWPLVAYVCLALAFLGSVQYMSLRRQWDEQKLPVSSELDTRWARSTVPLLGIMPLALLAPIAAIMFVHAMAFASTAVLALGVTVASDLTHGFHWFLGIFSSRPDLVSPPAPVSHGPPAWHHHHATMGGSPGPGASYPDSLPLGVIGDLGRGLILWAIVLIGLGYRLRRLRRAGSPAGQTLPGGSELLSAIARFLTMLLHFLRGYNLRTYVRSVRQAGPVRPILPRPVAARPMRRRRFARARALSSRERVRSYYRDILTRADRSGYPRLPSQTPAEFARMLARQVTASERGDLERLTGSFLEAQYSRHHVDAAQADRVHGSWRRVRSALRKAAMRRRVQARLLVVRARGRARRGVPIRWDSREADR